MRVLVTGGAGYIGSVTTRLLLDAGHEVVVYDNLTTGFREVIPSTASFIFGDIRDRELLPRILKDRKIEAIIHFAAKLVVPESVKQPAEYYENNVGGSLNIIQSCLKSGVDKLIFSSTAAVYGNPEKNPIDETGKTGPLNPYGSSKLMVENILRDLVGQPLRSVCLRYFNVAGATPDLLLGQRTRNATHLIKVAAEVACGKRESLQIFGDDYPTADGTGVRDYIHVQDLASAHVLALEHLARGGASELFNCGYGRGFSVKQVVETMREVSGHPIPATTAPRREGDAAAIVADSSKITKTLGWEPSFGDLAVICRTAYEFEKKLS